MSADGSLIFDTALDTKGFERGSAKLTSAVNSFVKGVAKIGNLDIGSARFQTQVANAKESLAGLRQQLDTLGQQTITTENYENVTRSISKAEQALIQLVKRQEFMSRLGVSENSSQWKRLELQIQDAEAALERLNAQKEQMETDGSAFTSGVDTEQYAQLDAALGEAEARLSEYESSARRAAGASSGLTAALRGIGGAAASAAKFILLLPLNAVAAGFKKAASGIAEYIKNIGKSHSATSGLLKGLTSLKTMLFSRVKRMFISNIFNEMKNAMTALQQYDTSFGAAMNNMKSAASGLSANLAVSFGGLISAIEPVLTRIINAVSTAISYINALFAMLSGKTTMTVAKKQMGDYAKSTGGAANAAKELNRQLMGFDEINKLQDNNDNGGGGGGGNPGDLFEEVPIDSLLPDSVRDFFERIKEAFEAGDWESIGSIIAEGLNAGTGTVDDWITGTLQPLAVLWSGRIALLLNGLIKGVDWKLMGKTIADGLNTVFMAIDTFLSTFDFAATGSAVANLITGFFGNIDWASIAHGLGEAVEGVFEFLSGFIQTIDWAALPRDIYDAIITAISEMDWTGIARAIAEFIGSAFGADMAFKMGIWNLMKDFGKAIIDGLLQGSWERIMGIGEWIKTNIFEPFMNGFREAFGIHSPSTVMQEQGGFIIDGLLLGIQNAWSKITTFFSTSLSGLNATLSSAWSNIRSVASAWWSNITFSVTDIWNSLASALFEGVASLKSGMDEGWNDIKETATRAWNELSTAVTDLWGELRTILEETDWASVGSNLCSGILDGILEGWDWLMDAVYNLANSLLNIAKSVLGIHSPSRVFRDVVGKNIGLGLAEGIENSEADVNRSVAALAKSTTDGFGSRDFSFGASGSSDMVSGLDRVADRLSAIADTFRSITAMLNEVGSLTVPEIATGTVAPPRTRVGGGSEQLSGGFNSVDTANAIAQAVFSAVTQALSGQNNRKQEVAVYLDGKAMARRLYPYNQEVAREHGGSLING